MPEAPSDLRLITFRVGTETFVLDIMAVRQIVPYTGSTAIPTAPAFIEGIVVLRSEVIPIIDLRDRLYPHLEERASEPLVLIAHSSAGVIGLKVDEVRRIITVPADSLLAPPPIVRGIRGELLIAVVPHADEIHLLIDIENVLTDDEKGELREAELSLEHGTGNTERGTRNTERGTRNGEHGTMNAEHGTRNTERGTRNDERGTRNGEHGTRNDEC